MKFRETQPDVGLRVIRGGFSLQIKSFEPRIIALFVSRWYQFELGLKPLHLLL